MTTQPKPHLKLEFEKLDIAEFEMHSVKETYQGNSFIAKDYIYIYIYIYIYEFPMGLLALLLIWMY